jgi:hypothetical protein
VASVAFAVAVGAASAAVTANSAAWTEGKAERTVVRDAVVRLSPARRAALESELGSAIRQYRALELAANDMGDQQAASRFHNVVYRLSSALAKVEGGLAVTEAECTGAGPGTAGRRFTRFRCQVASERLAIPSPELGAWSADQLPAVVEGAPRILDSIDAWLMVRTKGSAAISYRQVEAHGFVPS